MAENSNLLFLEQLAEGSKRKKRMDISKKHRKHRKFNDADLRRLLKGKTIRTLDKDKYVDLLLGALPYICKEIQRLYNNDSKILEDKETAVDLFTNPTFVKRLKQAVEEDDGQTNVDEIFTFVGDLFNSRDKALQSDEKVVKAYTKMYAKYVGVKKIKKLSKEFKCKEIQILSILLAAQSYEGMKHKFITNKFRGTMTEIYKLENLSKKGFLELIKLLFPKRRNMIIGFLLGEGKNRVSNEEGYDVVSDCILGLLEKMDQDDRKDILKRYAKYKEKNPKMRGGRLGACSKDYPRVEKTIERLIDTGYSKESLQ